MARVIQQKPTTAAAETTTHSRTFKNKWKKKYKNNANYSVYFWIWVLFFAHFF